MHCLSTLGAGARGLIHPPQLFVHHTAHAAAVISLHPFSRQVSHAWEANNVRSGNRGPDLNGHHLDVQQIGPASKARGIRLPSRPGLFRICKLAPIR